MRRNRPRARRISDDAPSLGRVLVARAGNRCSWSYPSIASAVIIAVADDEIIRGVVTRQASLLRPVTVSDNSGT